MISVYGIFRALVTPVENLEYYRDHLIAIYNQALWFDSSGLLSNYFICNFQTSCSAGPCISKRWNWPLQPGFVQSEMDCLDSRESAALSESGSPAVAVSDYPPLYIPLFS